MTDDNFTPTPFQLKASEFVKLTMAAAYDDNIPEGAIDRVLKELQEVAVSSYLESAVATNREVTASDIYKNTQAAFDSARKAVAYRSDEPVVKAKTIVRAYVNQHEPQEEPFEVFVIWFSKTLQNWKAVLATDRDKNDLFEVTYDGDQTRAYLDTYDKTHNFVISDFNPNHVTSIQGDNS